MNRLSSESARLALKRLATLSAITATSSGIGVAAKCAMRTLVSTLLLLVAFSSSAATWTAKTSGNIDHFAFESNAIAATGDTLLEIDANGRIVRATKMLLSEVRIARAGSSLALAGGPPNQSGLVDVAKMRRSGEVEWARRITAPQDLRLAGVAGAEDGSIFVAAEEGEGQTDVAHLDAQGNLAWQTRYSYSGSCRTRAIVPSEKGGALVVGSLGAFGTAVMLDAHGDLAWAIQSGFPDASFQYVDAVRLSGGQFVLAGNACTPRTCVIVCALLTSSGTLGWQKVITAGPSTIARSMAHSSGDRVAIAAAGTRAILFVVDKLGTLWDARMFGEVDADNPRVAVGTTTDGAIVFSWSKALQTTATRIESDRSCGAEKATARSETKWLTGYANEPIAKIGDATVTRHGFIAEATNTQWSVTECQPQASNAAVSPSATTSPGAPMRREQGAIPLQIAPQPSAAAPVKPAAGTPIVDAMIREHEAFSKQVAQMLADRKYRELDQLEQQLVLSRAHFPSGAWKLWWFRAAFRDLNGEPFAGMGDAGVRARLDEWRATAGSAVSRTATATYDLARAWQARGTGYNNTVTPGGAREYDRLREKSAAQLAALHAEHKCDLMCLDLMIDVGKLGGWSSPLREIAQQAPGYWHAFAEASVYLLPQWGGSAGEVERFAREAADATRSEMGDAVYMKVDVAVWGASENGIGNPHFDWARLKKGFEDFQTRFPRSAINLGRFAAFAWEAQDRATARRIFVNPLLEWNGDPAVRNWALEGSVPMSARPAAPAATTSIVRSEARWDDWTEHPIVFFVTASGHQWGVSATEHHFPRNPEYDPPASLLQWVAQGRPLTNAIEIPADPYKLTRVLLFPTAAPTTVPAFAVGASAMGQRLFIVACRVVHGQCEDARMTARELATDRLQEEGGPVAVDEILGAPVVDDRGLVVGIVVGENHEQLRAHRTFLVVSVADVLSMSRKTITLPAAGAAAHR